MSQLFIAVFGLAGAYLALLSPNEAHRRLAPWAYLIGQPFWLYETGRSQQWGMFALSCAYTVLYLCALWHIRQSARNRLHSRDGESTLFQRVD